MRNKGVIYDYNSCQSVIYLHFRSILCQIQIVLTLNAKDLKKLKTSLGDHRGFKSLIIDIKMLYAAKNL